MMLVIVTLIVIPVVIRFLQSQANMIKDNWRKGWRSNASQRDKMTITIGNIHILPHRCIFIVGRSHDILNIQRKKNEIAEDNLSVQNVTKDNQIIIPYGRKLNRSFTNIKHFGKYKRQLYKQRKGEYW